MEVPKHDDIHMTKKATSFARTNNIHHSPNRFSTIIDLNIKRGMNIINVWSGHQMAAWVYEGTQRIDGKYVTWENEPKEKLLMHNTDAAQLQDNDTIFVSYAKLQEFTSSFLPLINTTFVLITVPFRIMYPKWVGDVAPKIIHHPSMLHWFATNIQNYTGGYQRHKNVSSFPLGLKPDMGSRDFQHPIRYYKKHFLGIIHDNNNASKPNDIFVSRLGPTSSGRRGIPSSKRKLGYEAYLKQMARARSILSPNGDHPDCHRHYEALGLGTMPITELDPNLYSHLHGTGVVFNNSNWNLTELKQQLRDGDFSTTPVNRNAVFEEYWMEHVERIVGRPLRWWDVASQKKLKLEDFSITSNSTTSINATSIK